MDEFRDNPPDSAPNSPADQPLQGWDPLEERTQLEKVLSAGIEFKPGDRVRLQPRHGGDIFDIALSGKTATIASIEQDFENRIHLAVAIDEAVSMVQLILTRFMANPSAKLNPANRDTFAPAAQAAAH